MASDNRQIVDSNKLSSLHAVCESVGCDLVDVTGNGDCMFEVLSVSLSSYNMHYDKGQLRRILSEYLRDHPFVDDNEQVPRKDFIDPQYLRLGKDISDSKLAWNIYIHRIGLLFCDGGIWGD